MMDLLGADLPVEGAAPGNFAWYLLLCLPELRVKCTMYVPNVKSPLSNPWKPAVAYWNCCDRCDGPLLGAIRSGAWVLLDELNLANQSVLEGLNAVLDHRAEVYIPELAATFRCAPGFRLFAAQNPLQEV